MRVAASLYLCIMLISACRDTGVDIPDGLHVVGGDNPPLGDMATPKPPSCTAPAATGLIGENRICVDFSKDSLSDLTTKGWNFDKFDKSCWTIIGGKLMVDNFSVYIGSCGFFMPALSSDDYQKYNSFTISVVQTVDLDSLQQKAQVMLGGDDPQRRLLDWLTGKQPRKRWVQTITKANLPPTAAGAFQPLFKLTSDATVGMLNQGWQIESIAVNVSQ